MTWSSWNKPTSTLMVMLVLSIFGAFLRFLALNQTSYANGWDGYYYVMQAHSWMEYGHLQSLDYSLVYPFYIGLAYLLGDYELAFKVTSALISGLAICSIALLVYQLKRRLFPVVFILSWMCFSPLFTYFVVQFPKNVLGLAFFFGLLLMVQKRSLLGTLMLFLLTLMTHRMMAGFALIVLMVYGLQFLPKRWLLVALGLAGLLSSLPGIFHWSDLERFDGMFSIWPQFAPWSFYKLFESAWSLWWSLDVGLMAVVLIFTVFCYVKGKLWQHENFLIQWCFPLLIGLSLFPFMGFTNGSLGYRFFMVVPLFVLIYIILMLPTRNDKLVLTSSFVFLLMSLFSYKSYQPALHDPPNRVYELISQRLQTNYHPTDYPLVIVHKSLAEMIIYRTDFDALNWQPEANVAQTALRITNGLSYYYFAKYLNPLELQKVKKLTTNYYSLPENLWNEFLDRIRVNDDHELMKRIASFQNPMEVRPAFLTKSKQLP